MTGGRAPRRWAVLRASSLRWRVTVVVIAVATLLMVSVGIVVDVVLDQQLEHQLNAQMSVHAQRATMLIQEGLPADQMVRQLHDRAVIAELRAADGSPLSSGPYAPVNTPKPAAPSQQVVFQLPDGTQLVLTTDDQSLDGVQDQLRLLIVVVGGAGLVLAAIAMLVGVRAALRPLDTMTGLAEAITAGDRGHRLRPRDPRTELGRTATAFDTMLDALESAQSDTEAAASAAREAEAVARRSEATLRRFLADAAHELRTPLTGMQGLAETLVRHPDLELSRREELATTMVRETRRATHLVAEMLELARIEGGLPLRLERRDLGALTALAGQEARRAQLLAPTLTVSPGVSPAGVSPGADGHPSGSEVLVDEGRITQIVTNLLDNACRHTPVGGTVGVTVERNGTEALLTVRDSGPGVAEVDRERIFDRLVRLDDARARDSGGAGLGLPIARALARAHGGELAYLPGQPGGAFQLRLPLRPTGIG
jgi:two-component system, OmpR family, sensor kinase